MVTYVSRSKDRIFHPRFLALMNHYVIEPVACTPASGWGEHLSAIGPSEQCERAGREAGSICAPKAVLPQVAF